MSELRVRRSIQELYYEYEYGGNKTPIENLVRAFRHIQQLSPDDPDSFFMIGGYHGEPFHGKGDDADYWGGYCNHGTVLFPTWHRMYLKRIEDALRSAPGCGDVTLPFWDECFQKTVSIGIPLGPVSGVPKDDGTQAPLPSIPHPSVDANPVPEILTNPKFTLDGVEIDNPLYSYTLQQALEAAEGTNGRYTKPAGYATVRYPLSGLVGTPEDREVTKVHNEAYKDPAVATDYLNKNVKNWLDGNVELHPPPDTRVPDTTSVYSRFLRCLKAPNFTAFSNKTSAAAFGKNAKAEAKAANSVMADHDFVTSLEDPHNAIHLAVGGFWQPGVYVASPIKDANGDMGDNETAGFDPIFYMHHAFIDYVFWTWQKRKNVTKKGSLHIMHAEPPIPGTISPGIYMQPKGTVLTMDTPLYPFEKSKGRPYTSADTVDIEAQLGYTYGPGSLDAVKDSMALEIGGEAFEGELPPITTIKRIKNIFRSQIPGSFVVRYYAKIGEKEYEIGRDPILSRWNVGACANCQGNLEVESLVPIHESLAETLSTTANGEKVEYIVKVDTRPGVPVPWEMAPQAGMAIISGPIVEDL